MKTLNKLFFLLTSAMVLLTSCGSDDNDSNSNNPSSKENSVLISENFQTAIDRFEVPENLSNIQDPNALFVSSTIESSKLLLTSYAGLFNIPDNAFSTSAKGATNNDTERFSWSDGQGNAVVYTLTETSEGFTIQYDVTLDGVTGTLYSGFISKNGAKGNLVFNDISTASQEVLSYSWEFVGSKVIIDYIIESNKITTTIDEDGSGTLEVFDGDIKTTLYTWDVDGSGSVTNLETGETFMWSAS